MTVSRGNYNIFQQLTSARLVSTSNVSGTYNNGPSNSGVGATITGAASTLTIDSVLVNDGDRVLLVAQTSANQNGVYDKSTVNGVFVLTRSDDFQNIEQVKAGQFIPVSAGTANAGSMYIVVEPLPAHFGVDDLVFESVQSPGGGSATFSDVTITSSITIPNAGLHLLDTNASHDLIISPGSDLTADRTLTVTTGDANRTLDISAGSVTISAFGASLVDDASNLLALTTLGVKRGTTAVYGGGGTSNAFVATGLLATDIVVASLLSSTNAVAINTAVPTADTLTVSFTADPGANTVVNWIAIATV